MTGAVTNAPLRHVHHGRSAARFCRPKRVAPAEHTGAPVAVFQLTEARSGNGPYDRPAVTVVFQGEELGAALKDLMIAESLLSSNRLTLGKVQATCASSMPALTDRAGVQALAMMAVARTVRRGLVKCVMPRMTPWMAPSNGSVSPIESRTS